MTVACAMMWLEPSGGPVSPRLAMYLTMANLAQLTLYTVFIRRVNTPQPIFTS